MSALPDLSEFVASARREAPPALPAELTALWWAKRADWDRAHRIVQDLGTVAASRVHAYLHRVEGDLDNAAYWYRRAGVARSDVSLDEEWDLLASELLAQASADSALR